MRENGQIIHISTWTHKVCAEFFYKNVVCAIIDFT